MKKFILALALALLASVSSRAQQPQARFTYSNSIIGASTGVLEIGSGVQFHQITWNVVGSVPTCQVQLDQSADNATWSSQIIATQACTSNGLSTVSTATVANYVRINITTKSGAGTVTVTYLGYTSAPSGGGTVTGTGAPPEVAVWLGAGSLFGAAAFTDADGTNSAGVFNGPPTSTLSANLQAFNGFGLPELRINRHVLSTDSDGFLSGSIHLTQYDKNVGVLGSVNAVDATNLSSGSVDAAFNYVKVNVPAGQTNGQITSGTSTQLIAYGTGNLSNVFASYVGESFNIGAGTLTNMAVYHALLNTNTGGGTVHNNYGYSSIGQDNVGDTLNAEYFAAPSLTTPTNFAFYNASGRSRFNLLQADTYSTVTNCAANGTGANPSVVSCGANAAGMFSCATAASTGTCQVNTTAVTANSEIFITQDAADGGASQLNVTCNTGNDLSATAPILASKNTGVSFTINLGTVVANPACFEYHIVN